MNIDKFIVNQRCTSKGFKQENIEQDYNKINIQN